MRTPLIAGNWKMHNTVPQARELVRSLRERLPAMEGVEVAVCPPFTALQAVAQELGGSRIALGAQDLFWEEKGAFTGQISPAMLVDLCCRYVIVGHSERRGRFGKDPGYPQELTAIFGETDRSVNRKLKAALAAGLIPIMCLGETLAEREARATEQVVSRQLQQGLAELTAEQVAGMVIAYEPVWAIGTGQTCERDEANRVIGLIRGHLEADFGEPAAQRVRIQYGGSVTDQNAADLLVQPEIDGALVGGASLDAGRFAEIVLAQARVLASR